MSSEITHRAAAGRPCPVCGSESKGCSATADGLHLCRGEPGGGWRPVTRGPDDAGFGHYRKGEPERRERKAARPRADWPARARQYADALDPERRAQLARSLGLPADALDPFPLLGFNREDRRGRCFTFPEFDAAGRVAGLSRRYADGSKRSCAGSARGLSLPEGWRDRPGPVFLVEGPTDTAALTAAGLAAVGRPSNAGGVGLLAELFRQLPPDRAVLVVGENDRKDDGAWPGRDGAEGVAGGLADRLGRPVPWALPPDAAKDVRAWLTDPARGETPWPARGAELAAALLAAATESAPAGPDEAERVNERADDPHRLALVFLSAAAPGGPPFPLRFWRGEFHRYAGGAYAPVPDDDLRAELAGFVRAEFVRVFAAEFAAWRDGGEEGDPPTVRPVTRTLIGNVLQAIGGACRLPAAVDAPAWVDGATGPDPAAVLPVANGILDLAAAAARRPDALLPPSLSFFTPTAAPFRFDPAAPPPAAWLGFLNELWPDDPESAAALQDWMGYLLVPDTRQQKILFMVGPKRGGKGTVARVLRELVGPGNVAAPTLGSLTTNFGMAPLIGKSVAVISDARLSGRADTAVVTERLLSVSGEDAQTIDRKHRDQLTVKLPTRFVILSNELPRLGDASGALCGRLILLRLTRSWFGREDPGLFDRLRAELPGILLWAVEGWRRLRERGRFVQPASGVGLVEDMEALSSPVGAFVQDRCVTAPGFRVEVSELYHEWRRWCEAHGRKEPGTEETFGRDLRAAVPAVEKTRTRTPDGRLNCYAGIRVRVGSDPDPDPPGGGGHRGHRDQPMHTPPPSDGAEGRKQETTADGRATAGRGDHGDQGARRWFGNNDRPHDLRGW